MAFCLSNIQDLMGSIVLLHPECPETVAEQTDARPVAGNLVKYFEGAAIDGFILRIADDEQPENHKPHYR